MKFLTILFFKWMLSTAGFIQIALLLGLIIVVKLVFDTFRYVSCIEDFKYVVTEKTENIILICAMFAFFLLAFINSIAGNMSFMGDLGEWLDGLFTRNK